MSMLTSLFSKTLFTGSTVVAGAFSLFSGIKYWLIAIALVGVLSGLSGYYAGTSHAEKIMARELTVAAASAKKSQASQDAKDYAKTKQDMARRGTQSQMAQAKIETIYRNRAVLVPNPTHCKIPASSMKLLNDSALIGTP